MTPEPSTDAGNAKQTGEARVEAIRQDLACPNCEYNLRGLLGDVVTCPECGSRCDVASLITARWTGKWYKAPGLNRLMLPVSVAYLGGLIGIVIAMVWGASNNFSNQASFYLIGLVLLVIWSTLMVNAGLALRNSAEAVALAFLAHLIMAGYLAGLFAILTVVGFGVSFFIQSGISNISYALIAFLIACVLFAGGRRGEKFIAGRCIRECLRRQSSAG